MIGRSETAKTLTSEIYPFNLQINIGDNKKGTHRLFKGITRDYLNLSCHFTELWPDSKSHAPHSHKEEELIVLLSGCLEIIFPEEKNPEKKEIFSF